MDSFLQFLQRNDQLADSRRTGYYNLFRLTRRVAHLKANLAYWNPTKCQREWGRLQEDIEDGKTIFNKAWLVQQLHKLNTGLTD